MDPEVPKECGGLMLDLTERVVVVTGASSGFGRSTAAKFAHRGACVAALARSTQALNTLCRTLQTAGKHCLAVPVDVGDPQALQQAHARVVSQLGPVEILVNNAGMNVGARRIQDTTLEEWDRIQAVNLTGAFHLTKLVLPAMQTAGRGTIINVASRAGNYPSLLAGVAYSSSKIGMRSLTRVTNEEGNPHNVRAILINPGVGATPLLDQRPEPPPPAVRAEMLQADDIADAILFAASLPYRVCIEHMDVYPTSPHVG